MDIFPEKGMDHIVIDHPAIAFYAAGNDAVFNKSKAFQQRPGSGVGGKGSGGQTFQHIIRKQNMDHRLQRFFHIAFTAIAFSNKIGNALGLYPIAQVIFFQENRTDQFSGFSTFQENGVVQITFLGKRSRIRSGVVGFMAL